MKDAYTWATILAVVFSSTASDVLTAQAMQKIGDFGELRRRVGNYAVCREWERLNRAEPNNQV